MTYITPNGNPLELVTRPDTNDSALAAGILASDEYRLRDHPLTGWALDIGAHIGTVALSLALDNPDLQVIAVEPVPDNAALIFESIALNGLLGRVFVEEAAAGRSDQDTIGVQYAYTDASNPDKDYIHQSRFVGNVFRPDEDPSGTWIDAPVVTIPSLLEKYELGPFGIFRFCKIDCESCEWDFLADHADSIEEIVGEWHDAPIERLVEMLGQTHSIQVLDDKGGIGMFRALAHWSVG